MSDNSEASQDHPGDLAARTERPERRLGSFVALSLNFTLRPEHVRAEDRVLSLKCTAEVLELYWRTSEVVVTVSSPPGPRNWLAGTGPAFSAGPRPAPLLALLLTNCWILRNV